MLHENKNKMFCVNVRWLSAISTVEDRLALTIYQNVYYVNVTHSKNQNVYLRECYIEVIEEQKCFM